MSSNDDPKRPKKGIKLDNSKSSIQPKPNQAAIFDEKAKEAFSKYEDYKQRTWDLSTKFKAMIEDKILPENKSILSKDIEAEVINKLVALASDMNEDENQPESIGSTALSMLLMKMLLVQRDTINSILFKFDKLEKSLLKDDKKV